MILLVAAGCYGPTPPAGAPCTATDDCPDPLICDRGVCVREVVPVDGTTGIDANPNCQCVDATTISCEGVTTTCALGCVSEPPGARCGVIVPSNGVPIDLAGVSGAIQVDAVTTFDTETGEVTGDVIRAPGEGATAGIGFARRTSGASLLGVFTFEQLVVATGGTVRFTGPRAAVFVVATSATIEGTIDGTGGCYGADHLCAGPGGGAGAEFNQSAGGCGPGGSGMTDPDTATGADGGGGGGGGGGVGGNGGTAGSFAGGSGGTACVTATLEPLEGGSGGAGAGPGGAAPSQGGGGGGGGALQLTAGDQLIVRGTITMGGAGGAGGAGAGGNAAGGGGGGGGGGILLEAPIVEVAAGSVVAANGGAGGGGGSGGNSGMPGQAGQPTATPATGGAIGGFAASRGGNGAAGMIAAQAALNVGAQSNAGGGGGAAGRIYVRASGPAVLDGVLSPAAGTGPVVAR